MVQGHKVLIQRVLQLLAGVAITPFLTAARRRASSAWPADRPCYPFRTQAAAHRRASSSSFPPALHPRRRRLPPRPPADRRRSSSVPLVFPPPESRRSCAAVAAASSPYRRLAILPPAVSGPAFGRAPPALAVRAIMGAAGPCWARATADAAAAGTGALVGAASTIFLVACCIHQVSVPLKLEIDLVH